jgi:hypothetical protein
MATALSEIVYDRQYYFMWIAAEFFSILFLRQTLWRKIFLGDGSTVAEASTGHRSKCQLSPTFASLARKMCFAGM